MYQLLIERKGFKDSAFEPAVLNGVQITQERSGAPSQIKFTVIKDDIISFNEGAKVWFYYEDQLIFVGYVFTKKRTKEHHIEVTAYDQLRYFKNKFTYVFEKTTASEIIKQLCADYGLQVGEIADTGYIIPSLTEDNKTLFDIALDALDETLVNTGKMYVLYDNCGFIELKELANMQTDVLIDDETAQDFNYTSSIDSNVYNKIVLYYVDEKTNDRLPFPAQDDSLIDEWGLLQYYEEVKIKSIGQNKANALLKLYGSKTRELKIDKAFGSIKVRAGSLLVVKLNLGDTVISNFLLVDKVTHNFENDNYTMDLTLNGNWGD